MCRLYANITPFFKRSEHLKILISALGSWNNSLWIVDTKGRMTEHFQKHPIALLPTSVISLCSCSPAGYINVTLLTVIFQAILKIFLPFPLLLATWPQPTGMPLCCHSSLTCSASAGSVKKSFLQHQ